MSRTIRCLTALSAAGALVVGIPVAAQADDSGSADAVGAVVETSGIDSDTLVSNLGVGESLSAPLATLTLPASASDPLLFGGQEGETVAVTLPVASNGSAGNQASDQLPGIVPVYADADGTAVATLVHDDGTVTLASVSDQGSPDTLHYGLDVPEGGSATLGESGGVLITGSSGEFVAL